MVLQMIDRATMHDIKRIIDEDMYNVISRTNSSLRNESRDLEEMEKFIGILKKIKQEYYSFSVPEAIRLSIAEFDEGSIAFVFYNNVRHRLWDLTREREKFRGVLIEQPSAMEFVQVLFDKAYSQPEIYTKLVRGASMISEVDNNTTSFYNIHRGNDMQCHGGLAESFFDNCKFSIELGLNMLIEGLATTNYDSPYASHPEELIKMFYLESNTTDPREDRMILEHEVNKQLPKISDIVNDVTKGLKSKSNKLHSYNADCYCYYCTTIHLMTFNKDNIRYDIHSKAIISRKDFTELFDGYLTGYEKKSLLYAIDKMKKYNDIEEVKYTVINASNLEDFVENNFDEIIDKFIEYNESDYDELKEMIDERKELNQKLDNKAQTILSYSTIVKELLSEKTSYLKILQ